MITSGCSIEKQKVAVCNEGGCQEVLTYQRQSGLLHTTTAKGLGLVVQAAANQASALDDIAISISIANAVAAATAAATVMATAATAVGYCCRCCSTISTAACLYGM
jgi:hypothetical protein